MKRNFRKLICFTMILSIMLLSGCKLSKDDITIEPIHLKYNLAEDELFEPLFVDENEIYASINKKVKTEEMITPYSEVLTNKFIVYDYNNGEQVSEYNINDNSYIYNARMYNDGIIYATYEIADYENPLNPKNTKWEIKFNDGKKTIVIDKGYCRDKVKIPDFAVLDDELYYMYEDYNKEYFCGIKKLNADFSKSDTYKSKTVKISEMVFRNNGHDYAILVEGKNDNEVGTILIGNKDGVYSEYNLEEYLTGYAMNDNYIFCCTTIDGEKYKARSICIDSGEEYIEEINHPLYRIASMSGTEVTAVDMEFNMYVIIPGETYSEISVDIPEDKQVFEKYVRYYPVDGSSTLAQVNELEFYKLSW